MAKICPDCGKVHPDMARFCVSCSAKLVAAPVEAEEPAVEKVEVPCSAPVEQEVSVAVEAEEPTVEKVEAPCPTPMEEKIPAPLPTPIVEKTEPPKSVFVEMPVVPQPVPTVQNAVPTPVPVMQRAEPMPVKEPKSKMPLVILLVLLGVALVAAVIILLNSGGMLSDDARMSTTECLSTTACDHDYLPAITRQATYDAEGEMTYTCSKCDSTYTEVIAKLEKHVVPASVLDAAVSNARYRASAFSVSVGKLVNSAIDNYSLKHYTGEEAISKGYLKKDQIDSSVDIDYLYCSVISGETMINPDIPYLTEYEQEAVKVWMIFNENDELVNYGVELCSNLETYAILMMSSGY